MRALGVLFMFVVLPGCSDWDALSSTYDAGPDDAKPRCAAYVAAGATHSCARMTDGSLYCWGDNRFGQLGTGDARQRPTPVRVRVGDLAVARIEVPVGFGDITSALAVFSCAVTADDAAWCWGDNGFGQLGTGGVEPHLTPNPVGGLSAKVARLGTGAGHVCSQTSSGGVYCWGRNLEGQLGTGDKDPRMSPDSVAPAMPAVDRIATGGAHSCARGTDGSLWCWGGNEHGQLGTGTTDPELAPAKVQAFTNDVSSVSAGGTHTCAYTSDGSAWCWGNNQQGQLGSAAGDVSTEPAEVDLGGDKVAHVYAGGAHSCAAKVDGSLWCWGSNTYGQLGTGDDDPRPAPAQAGPSVLGNDVSAASSGAAHTCALKKDGSVWCWGNNQYGQVGVASAGPSRSTPIEVIERCP